MLADSMTAARLIIGNLGAFRFDGQLAATLYQSSRARKSPAEDTVDKIMSMRQHRGAASIRIAKEPPTVS